MPNWVRNQIDIFGTIDKVKEFQDHIAIKPEFYSEGEGEHGFSFHSFITPQDMTVDEYKGTVSVTGPTGAVVGTSGGNWYDWNIANWNTKWDACDVNIAISNTTMSEAMSISFDTAWSPPEPVFLAMVEQYPDLTFEVWWEEEQGFGGRYVGKNGILECTESWDIPESHADYESQNKDCVCSYESDEVYWFEDCPGKQKNSYVVEVVTKYYVIARNDDDAIEAAKASESGYDLPDGAEVTNVEYAEEYRFDWSREEVGAK